MGKKLVLQLPFRGSWFVFWGGDTKEQNYHHDDSAQKYALDMVILDKDGSTYSGSGTKNKDYYAYGKDIVAPANGKVIEIVDGLRDNVPQKTTNDYAYNGNFVMIKHSDGIYSTLCHLRSGSILVEVGQSVKRGQKLGECGNSGNSSEPHLHFHVMDSDTLTVFDQDYSRKPKAKAIKTYFDVKLSRNGKTASKEQYAPVKGDTVAPLD
jgi:murein DD-endopeptidase MepM/ murein hydrolase activator NlpD